MKKAILFGIGASLFFSLTFILNRQMNIEGGSWIWSSSLRYIFMLPILFIIMILNNQLNPVIKDIFKRPIQWIIWSTVGFGLFYAPLSFASEYGASWLVAGTWQITIVAGAIMTPLFTKKIEVGKNVVYVRNSIPKKSLMMSSIILLGIFIMMFEEAKDISIGRTFLIIMPVVIAAFAYPLGNRKMMEVCKNEFTTFQRVFGMTLCSIPFWLFISIWGTIIVGLPSKGQVVQSFIVAMFSGVIATILFFKATDMVSNNAHKIAIIESTQAGEVIFTLLGGIFILNDKIPTTIGIVGIILVVIGMVLNSIIKS
ncbi:multidrug resistance efflux transporter family protein [Clostridium septicum]|uniref:DMT family transporter n=1 Tax=Clostridium septicum TaxID=1504 RepID=UPI00083325AE|nr:multidrug resistance efflux transporter family protein [Clostridium septicum]